jgi:hypothetical protein
MRSGYAALCSRRLSNCSVRWYALAVLVVLAGCTTTASNMTEVTSPSQLPGYPQGYERVFSASVDVVSLLGWELKVAQRDAGVITAKTGVNLATWGDNVTIRVFRPDSARRNLSTRLRHLASEFTVRPPPVLTPLRRGYGYPSSGCDRRSWGNCARRFRGRHHWAVRRGPFSAD